MDMKNIAAAFIKAKKEFAPALKTSVNPHFKNRYADLAACIEAVDDAFLNNGIVMYQETFEDNVGVTVETVLLHESGEVIRCGKLHVPASKQDPQGYGSALSYVRRYSLMAACGIAPEDDDGNAATKTAPPQAAPKAAPAVPAPPKPPAAVPKKVEGKDAEWQLKVSAQPDTEFGDWLTVVVELTVTALDAAASKTDVMNIWRANANIYKIIEQQDPAAYDELTLTFKTYKESFDGN